MTSRHIVSRFLSLFLLLVTEGLFAAGNAGGNGGDFVAALKKAGLYEKMQPPSYFSDSAQAEIAADFFREGAQALWALFILIEAGYEFNPVITAEDIFNALGKLRDITENAGKIRLSNTLMLGNEHVTAINYPDGTIALNPLRWRMMEDQYAIEYSSRLKGMIAAHEVLSILPQKFESTGFYDISIKVVEFEKNYLSATGLGPEYKPTYPRIRKGEIPLDPKRWRESTRLQNEFGGQWGFPPEPQGMTAFWHVMHLNDAFYTESAVGLQHKWEGEKLFIIKEHIENFRRVANFIRIIPHKDIYVDTCDYELVLSDDPVVRLRQYRFEMLVRELYRLVLRWPEEAPNVYGQCHPTFKSLFDVASSDNVEHQSRTIN